MLFVKALGMWVVMLLAALTNGAIRETLIVPRLGKQVGHVVGVVVLSGMVFCLAALFVKALGPLPSSTLLHVGIFWLALSLLFEFGFFHYIMHEPWRKLLADDNVCRAASASRISPRTTA